MKTDIELKKDIIIELQWDPTLDSCEIGVTVKNGVVTLSGSVDRYTKKLAAENAVKKIAGVTFVADEIDVILPTNFKRNDAEIARTIMNAIKWHTAVREDHIRVNVKDGWATLEGEVKWQFQKDAVMIAIENLIGIRGISNLITVDPELSVQNVRRESLLFCIIVQPLILKMWKLKRSVGI